MSAWDVLSRFLSILKLRVSVWILAHLGPCQPCLVPQVRNVFPEAEAAVLSNRDDSGHLHPAIQVFKALI
jgi:hypothetical protein